MCYDIGFIPHDEEVQKVGDILVKQQWTLRDRFHYKDFRDWCAAHAAHDHHL